MHWPIIFDNEDRNREPIVTIVTEAREHKALAGVLGDIVLTGIYSWTLNFDEDDDSSCAQSSRDSSCSDLDTDGGHGAVKSDCPGATNLTSHTEMHGGENDYVADPSKCRAIPTPSCTRPSTSNRRSRRALCEARRAMTHHDHVWPMMELVDVEAKRALAVAADRARALTRRQEAQAKQRAIHKRKLNHNLVTMWRCYYGEQVNGPK